MLLRGNKAEQTNSPSLCMGNSRCMVRHISFRPYHVVLLSERIQLGSFCMVLRNHCRSPRRQKIIEKQIQFQTTHAFS